MHTEKYTQSQAYIMYSIIAVPLALLFFTCGKLNKAFRRTCPWGKVIFVCSLLSMGARFVGVLFRSTSFHANTFTVDNWQIRFAVGWEKKKREKKDVWKSTKKKIVKLRRMVTIRSACVCFHLILQNTRFSYKDRSLIHFRISRCQKTLESHLKISTIHQNFLV